MGLSTVITIAAVIVSVFIGVLNHSPDDAIIYRKLIEFSFSRSFKYGCFCMYNGVDETEFKVGESCSTQCTAQIIINDNAFYKKGVLGGAVGLGEAYTDNLWTYDNIKYDLGDILTELTVGFTNGEKGIADHIFNWLTIEKWQQWYERKYTVLKTEEEDKESAQSHYDIGDDVFETFLDETMFYTCAIFRDGKQSLYDAQINKINILTKKLNIDSSDRVLDFGCGWGYSPYHIHKNTGATAVGLTVSKNQYEYAKKRFANKVGNTNKLDYKYLDYRNFEKLTQYKFNKIISIGMTEHVGKQNIAQLFNVSTLILDDSKDNTIALHYFTQGEVAPKKIPISYGTACTTQTWIFKYIFPGCCLLNPSWVESAAIQFGFTLLHEEYYGIHYAKTLQLWREKWNEAKTKKMIEKKYGDINLWRVYEYYFAISEAMFRTGHVTLVHQVFVKPNKQNTKKYADVDYILNNFEVPNQK